MLIDTHCHINLPEYFSNPDEEVALALENDVRVLIAVATDMESSRRAVQLAEHHAGVYAVVGWHPNSAARYEPDSIEELATMCTHPKVVAIGEIGLDYHWDYATKDQQFLALTDQLNLAVRVGKPVVFHCREAYADLLALLESRPPHPYLMHCFAGDADDARRCVALDCYFGVDGPISYKKANDLRDVVRSLPHDRLVIETDAPFLSPEPYRGKQNRPAHVIHVNRALASCLGLPETSTAELTTANAVRFFGLSGDV